MNKRILSSLIILMIAAVEIFSQTVKITGNVVSKSDGEALIGATVREVGTQGRRKRQLPILTAISSLRSMQVPNYSLATWASRH